MAQIASQFPVQHVAHRPYFLELHRENITNIKNDHKCMGLLFIENFIFLVKKFFLAKFQKLASERNFDLEQKKIFFLEKNR